MKKLIPERNTRVITVHKKQPIKPKVSTVFSKPNKCNMKLYYVYIIFSGQVQIKIVGLSVVAVTLLTCIRTVTDSNIWNIYDYGCGVSSRKRRDNNLECSVTVSIPVYFNLTRAIALSFLKFYVTL